MQTWDLELTKCMLLECVQKMVMDHETENEEYEFMFNVQSPEHIYYRWRTYSLSQGDSLKSWRALPFQVRVAFAAVEEYMQFHVQVAFPLSLSLLPSSCNLL